MEHVLTGESISPAFVEGLKVTFMAMDIEDACKVQRRPVVRLSAVTTTELRI